VNVWCSLVMRRYGIYEYSEPLAMVDVWGVAEK